MVPTANFTNPSFADLFGNDNASIADDGLTQVVYYQTRKENENLLLPVPMLHDTNHLADRANLTRARTSKL